MVARLRLCRCRPGSSLGPLGLGEKGKRLKELTSVVQKRFNFPERSVELYAEKVNNRGLCAIAQAVFVLQASRRACCLQVLEMKVKIILDWDPKGK